MTTLNDAASSEQRESRRLALEDQLRQIEEEERRVAQDAIFCFNSSLPRLQERGSQSDLRDPSFTHPGSAIPNPAWGNVVEGLPSSKSSFSQSRQMSQSSYLPLQFHATLGQPSWAPLHGASSSRSPLPTTSISPSSTPQPPTPYTSGHQAVPVPSKAQVHDYLIKHMSMPQGLETGWLVNGQMFDVYTLLKTVLQMGGSSQVSAQDGWPLVAGMTGLLHERNQSVAQSREEVGRLLKEFYFKILGRLEILCEQTRGAGGTTLPVSNHFSTAEWPPPVQPSSSSKTSTVVVAPNWQTASPVPTPVTSRPPVSAAPSVPAGRADLQSHHTIRPASSGPSFTSSRSLPVPALLHPGLIQPTPVYPASNEVPSRLSLQRSVPTWSSSSGSQMLVSPHSASARQVIPRTASADGDVPLVPTFEDLAASNLLPLPPAPPGITLHTTGSIAHQYAMRCHNLRTAVRKMAAGEGGRALSREEMVFWNTLLAILKKNPNLIIPGVDETTVSPRSLPWAANGEGSFVKPASSTYSSVSSRPTSRAKPIDKADIHPDLRLDSASNGMRKAAFGRRRPLKLFDVSAAQIKRPPGGPRKVKSSEAAMLQEIVQSLEGDTAAFLINGGTLLGPDNGHHRSKTGTSGTSIPNPVSSIASSSTPAADFLKLIGARPKSTPSAAVPAMPLSQSPKRTIHLSGGHASEARLRKRDVRPPTNTVKQARAPSSPVKGRDAPGSSGDARSRPTQKASFASALPAQPTLSAARGPPRPSQSSGLASQLTIPNGDLTQLPASAVFDRLPSSASAGTASRDDVATGEVSNGRNQAASSENSAHVADHGLPSPPATQDTVSYDPNHQAKTLLASLAARSQPRRLRSPSIIAIESPAPLNTSVKQARARSPSITLISTPRKRLIPIVELLSSARKVWKAKSIRPPIDRVKVVIGIARRRRALLIKRGFYDAFRDDESEDDLVIPRLAYIPLRPSQPLPRSATARTARPRDPEPLPLRFITRPGPGLLEPFRSFLTEKCLLRRAVEHRCGWKGCDAVLASEDILRSHVQVRNHAGQGKFMAGARGNQPLYRCHWRGCEEPCFDSVAGLEQHMAARHISRVLICPCEDCDLTSPTISHLARHVTKQHDDPYLPRPLADLSQHLPPSIPIPSQPIPEIAHTDELTTLTVLGTSHRSTFHQEKARHKVQTGCFAGEDPVIHVEHPPHILEVLEHSASVPTSADIPLSTELIIGKEERLLYKVLGRKRRLEVFVELPMRRIKVEA